MTFVHQLPQKWCKTSHTYILCIAVRISSRLPLLPMQSTMQLTIYLFIPALVKSQLIQETQGLYFHCPIEILWRSISTVLRAEETKLHQKYHTLPTTKWKNAFEAETKPNKFYIKIWAQLVLKSFPRIKIDLSYMLNFVLCKTDLVACFKINSTKLPTVISIRSGFSFTVRVKHLLLRTIAWLEGLWFFSAISSRCLEMKSISVYWLPKA